MVGVSRPQILGRFKHVFRPIIHQICKNRVGIVSLHRNFGIHSVHVDFFWDMLLMVLGARMEFVVPIFNVFGDN
jgi:hypothetical protein